MPLVKNTTDQFISDAKTGGQIVNPDYSPVSTTTSTTPTTTTPTDTTTTPTDTTTTPTDTTTTPTTTTPATGLPGLDLSDESVARSAQVGTQVSTNLTDPNVPASAIQAFTPMAENADEVVDPTDARFQVGGDATDFTASTGTAADPVEAIAAIDAANMTAALTDGGAQGTAATQSQVDPGTEAIAALGALPVEALVQSQMEELTAGIADGNIPLWAKPASDAVEAALASRGLSRSSVGQAALTNAIISAALPMAQQNATAISANFAQDKQNTQQANMFNAQTSAQLQSQSLTNEQQMTIQNTNLRQQAMLSDQSATNAAAQFNAASQGQTDQFMANLETSVNVQNAARADSMSQFNAGQLNAAEQFQAQNQFAREQFNAQNATQIEQSNLQWRRQINQTNTAGVNAVNQANAMNAFNMSNQALTFMWQELRDSAKWSFEAAQNDEQRAAALAQAALQNEAATSATNTSAMVDLGKAAINIWKELRT